MQPTQLLKIVIFASGNGSNAERIMEHFQGHALAEVSLILSNKAEAGVHARAQKFGVESRVLSTDEWKNGEALLNLLQDAGADLIILAGYLKKVPDQVIQAYGNRILNIHPSLLPKHGGKGMYGSRVHQAVLDQGDKQSGITIHRVNEHYDQGEILLQKTVKIDQDWTPDDLAEAVHALEHEWFPQVVESEIQQIYNRRKVMSEGKKIGAALVSVYHKEGLDEIVRKLDELGVVIYSTGGTAAYIREQGVEVKEVADLTAYPSILGGRVKTLHPKVFGGILGRREEAGDREEMVQYEIPELDLVIVDLYPFEETVASGAAEQAIIEKIDIGGISLIRAAAKNFKDVLCVASREYYGSLMDLLNEQEGFTSLAQRKQFAAWAFDISSHYDVQIYGYLAGDSGSSFKVSLRDRKELRYGENPHQQAAFYGDLDSYFEQLNGKPLSYNNLLDVDAAVNLMAEFDDSQCTFAIFKHTNPCGVATGDSLLQAWERALECDPLSAFGGILICNREVDVPTAEAMHGLFFEVLIAPGFSQGALDVLTKKKKRVLLKANSSKLPKESVRTSVNGLLVQEKDMLQVNSEIYDVKTERQPQATELADVVFGEKIGKHLKSNAIGIVKNGQLIGSGIGQTSRVDALKQAVLKAKERGFELQGSILYSDAFFPFKDCAEIAFENGIQVLAEPGGSIRDDETIDFCKANNMCLIFTQNRHFKH